MSLIPIDPKLMEEAHKQKLRHQMHHDLCVLSAGGAKVVEGEYLDVTAKRAMNLYKELWLQVMKEIP